MTIVLYSLGFVVFAACIIILFRCTSFVQFFFGELELIYLFGRLRIRNFTVSELRILK